MLCIIAALGTPVPLCAKFKTLTTVKRDHDLLIKRARSNNFFETNVRPHPPQKKPGARGDRLAHLTLMLSLSLATLLIEIDICAHSRGALFPSSQPLESMGTPRDSSRYFSTPSSYSSEYGKINVDG